MQIEILLKFLWEIFLFKELEKPKYGFRMDFETFLDAYVIRVNSLNYVQFYCDYQPLLLMHVLLMLREMRASYHVDKQYYVMIRADLALSDATVSSS